MYSAEEWNFFYLFIYFENSICIYIRKSVFKESKYIQDIYIRKEEENVCVCVCVYVCYTYMYAFKVYVKLCIKKEELMDKADSRVERIIS
jgi:hypothetical protein